MLQTNSHRCLLFFCIASSVSMSGSNKLERFLYNFLGWKQQQPVHRPQDLTTTTKCFIWNSTLRQQQQRRIRQQKITIFQTKKNKRRTKTNRVITLRFSLIQEVFQSGKVHSFRTVGWASRTMLWFRREVKIMCLTIRRTQPLRRRPPTDLRRRPICRLQRRRPMRLRLRATRSKFTMKRRMTTTGWLTRTKSTVKLTSWVPSSQAWSPIPNRSDLKFSHLKMKWS